MQKAGQIGEPVNGGAAGDAQINHLLALGPSWAVDVGELVLADRHMQREMTPETEGAANWLA